MRDPEWRVDPAFITRFGINLEGSEDPASWKLLAGSIFQTVGKGRRLDVQLYVLDVPSQDFNPYGLPAALSNGCSAVDEIRI